MAESPSIRVKAKDFSSTGDWSYNIQLYVQDFCGDNIDFQKLLTIKRDKILADSLPIILKQPNNTLVFPNPDFSSYQWGYTDKSDPYLIQDVSLHGEIFQDYIAGSALDTKNREYWVEVGQGSCSSRFYFNYIPQKSKAPPLLATNFEVYIFPNPNTGHFELRLTGDTYGLFEVQIYNSIGRLLHREQLEKAAVRQFYPVDPPDLAAGLYFARIVWRNGRLEQGVTRKFIVH